MDDLRVDGVAHIHLWEVVCNCIILERNAPDTPDDPKALILTTPSPFSKAGSIPGKLKVPLRSNCRYSNTSRVEIIITISIENCTQSNKNFGLLLRAIFYSCCYYNVNPWGIFEHLTSFSLIRNQALEQGQVMAAVNSRKWKSKKMISNVRNGLKFGKICKKGILYTKM